MRSWFQPRLGKVGRAVKAKATSHLVVGAVQATGELPLEVGLGGGLLQEVRDPLHQEVPVLQVGKQKCHTILGADGEWAGQHVGAVRLLHDGHLEDQG